MAGSLAPSPPGDWANYLKAAIDACQRHWKITRGIEAAITSDLPPAAGLSSSSALVAGFMLAALRANDIHPTIQEMLEILPEAEQFVGTRGGGMDHAAVLASQTGCALQIAFAPLELSAIPIPAGWSFVIAHSLTRAEKSGPARMEYNARRTAGSRALEKFKLPSYRAAIDAYSPSELTALAGGGKHGLSGEEIRAFVHVVSEGAAVREAVDALRDNNAARFGELLFASHGTLRDQLRVSCPALDQIVEIAREAGALGARVTGAGFGGCAIIFCKAADRAHICGQLVRRYYAARADFDRESNLITAEPCAGAMIA